jgi:fructosamine-3-kinase
VRVSDTELLVARLAEAGLAAGVDATAPVSGGVIAVAGLVTLADGSRVFAKTLPVSNGDLFQVEAEGLQALRWLGGVNTPTVLQVTPSLLVLEPLQPRHDDDRFWDRLARMVAALHTTTASTRFGWHHDGWLGRLRQDNTWDDDGHSFFAQRRILRWLPEPGVTAELDQADRRALERLCARLPELVPAQPPVLTHGDLWSGNILADGEGAPALVDPAVSYTWPEVDLSMLWCSERPPESDRFFATYREVAGLAADWQRRMPILNLRELLSQLAHGDGGWGAADAVREIVRPFRWRAG